MWINSFLLHASKAIQSYFCCLSHLWPITLQLMNFRSQKIMLWGFSNWHPNPYLWEADGFLKRWTGAVAEKKNAFWLYQANSDLFSINPFTSIHVCNLLCVCQNWLPITLVLQVAFIDLFNTIIIKMVMILFTGCLEVITMLHFSQNFYGN